MSSHRGSPETALATYRWPGRAGLLFNRFYILALLIPLALGCYLAVAMTSVNAAPGETGLAAESLLQSGTIGNPYAVPTGPTAHVSPVHVGLVAAIYGVLGVNTTLARLGLSLVCLAAYLGGAAMVLLFCRDNGLGVAAKAAAILITCILPFQLFTAIVSLRQWDQPFAALILMASLLITADPALATRLRYRSELKLAGLAGLAGLVSPSILPTLIFALVMTLWKRTRLRDWRVAFLSLLVIAAMLVPWGLRNEAQLGSFIVTRSNFGLELEVGNRDGATGRSETDPVLHPHDSKPAAEHLAAIGEVPYMAEMTARAKAWIVIHPAEFARLTLVRLRLLLLPDSSIQGWVPLFGAETAGLLLTGFALVKLLALALVVLQWRRPLMWLVHTALPLAPYLITHVNARYEFPVLFTSTCLVCTAADISQHWLARKLPPGRGQSWPKIRQSSA